MWLVLGGPLAVVVAGILTAVIAMRAPDPLVAEDYYRRGLEAEKAGHNKGEPVASSSEAERPALEARNHAATPAGQRP